MLTLFKLQNFMKKTLLIILILAVVLIGWMWSSYNRLVVANENVDTQWAQVETQYQRRFDLIPNLVESVKSILTQEQKVFGDLAAARASYSGATTVNQKAEAATQVESALSRLLVIMENYPQLKSNETVQTFMSQLEGTENRVSVERNRFNEEVNTYNIVIKRLPTNILASMFGFTERAYFKAASGAETAPQVDLKL